ncbi:MAG: hypothetical protein HY369_02105 [Candidatus Aenigmarchaeota archaeon]|nr:hypothetical protein [Candidatus Aenigmarchaeota archaeon]
MSAVTIRIAYDGEALDSGTMNVRDLAPALLALADLFDEANKVLRPGGDSAVQVRVHPDFKPGSFEVRIDVVYSLIDQLLKFFADNTGSAIANLLEVLGFSGAVSLGLLKVVKWLKNRPVKKVELINDDNARLYVEGDSIVIKRSVLAVFNDLGVRKALAAMLSPLHREGISRFEVRSEKDNQPIEIIVKDELPAFEPPPPAQSVLGTPPLTLNHYQKSFTIVTLTFKEGNKWKVSDGSNLINVTIQDADFMRRVDHREAVFAKDDIIRCDVQEKQLSTPEGLKTEYAILKVIEHKHAPRQGILQLPAEAGKAAPRDPPHVAKPAKAPKAPAKKGKGRT